jgi:DNA-binding transcriptional regulator YiaG
MSEQPKERAGIADRIKANREQAGLSQSQAASAWGISKRTLQGWEQGKQPRGLYLQAVERILEKSAGSRK